MNIIEKTQKIGYAKEVENIDTKNYNTIISTIIIEIIEMLLLIILISFYIINSCISLW